VIEEKVLDFLKSNAKVTEVPWTADDKVAKEASANE
jgi:hypothetical protein